MPAGMAQTHLGVAADGQRFIYTAGGQLGAQCSPGVADCRVLDAASRVWGDLPPLPAVRYAPVLRLWHGRLHAVGGTLADRATPAPDHWSLGVRDGRALEDEWRPEVPIPVLGTHRGGAIINDSFFVFGGHGCDIRPYPNDPKFTCDWNSEHETTLVETVRLEAGAAEWKLCAPMPKPTGHTDFSVVCAGPFALVVGGVESHNRYQDMIQFYDTRTDQWRAAGRLPYAMKTNAAFYKGRLYVITGQSSRSADDPSPGVVLNGIWSARFDPTPRP